MGKTFYPPGAIFCRTCGYCLHGLPSTVCPECGHTFDPADARTFLARPRRVWPRRVLLWGGIPLLLLAVAYSALLGWLYMGWKAEAAARGLDLGPLDEMQTRAILPLVLSRLLPGCCHQWQERVDTLKLWKRTLSGEEIISIAACRRLRVLYLVHVPLKGQDVALICQCRALQELILNGNGLVDNDAEPVSSLPNLRLLGLPWNGRLDDSALAAAAQLEELMDLGLAGTSVTDRGLSRIVVLQNLRTLNLWDCSNLTDACLPHLSRLKGLTWIHLEGTHLTPAGVKQLKQALPLCTIDYP